MPLFIFNRTNLDIVTLMGRNEWKSRISWFREVLPSGGFWTGDTRMRNLGKRFALVGGWGLQRPHRMSLRAAAWNQSAGLNLSKFHNLRQVLHRPGPRFPCVWNWNNISTLSASLERWAWHCAILIMLLGKRKAGGPCEYGDGLLRVEEKAQKEERSSQMASVLPSAK